MSGGDGEGRNKKGRQQAEARVSFTRFLLWRFLSRARLDNHVCIECLLSRTKSAPARHFASTVAPHFLLCTPLGLHLYTL
jgi:hypothetical protein